MKMTLIKHELRRSRVAFGIWTGSIAAMLAVCVFLFPEMRGQTDAITEAFGSMGSFTAAFGMDVLNFGTLIGFYAIECGNVLGLGGAFFAALTAIGALSGEEKEGTAEFLLTHPVSRRRVITEKLAGALIQVTALSLTVFLISMVCIGLIGEEIPWKEFGLLHLAYYLLQLELTGICFGLSAFVRKGAAGVGMGVAMMLYFANLIANITEEAEFLKYITPFGFADGADIVGSGALDVLMVAIGMVMGLCGVGAAYWKYTGKDIH